MDRRRFLGTSAAAGLGLVAGCSGFLGDGSGDVTWKREGGSVPASAGGDYTGFQGGPAHLGVADGAVEGDLGVAWSLEHPSKDTGQQAATPAITDGTVYAAEGTIEDGSGVAYVTALDLESGTTLWEYRFEGTNVVDDVVVADGVVLQRFSGVLVAIDAEEGEELWRHDADLDVTPAANDGTVFVSGSDISETHLYALDVGSGERRWSVQLDVSGRWIVPPAVRDGLVYHVEEGVVGRDVADGTKQWTGTTDRGAITAPTVTDDRLLVGTTGNRVAAIDRATGEQAWSSELESGAASGGGRPSSPAVTGEHVVATSAWAATVLDAGSGDEVWSKTTDADGPPVVAGDTVFVAGLTELAGYALDDGSRRGRFETENGSGSSVSPAIVDGVVCYPSDELYALASTA